ncbi:1-deoxy-D-xylulose-5-phosphate reductoisomerase [Gammaproteobacteria bacterium]|nr:1-deoxy-D-xylulose-5-phosphate reductoisomerase [Gammaproteobacteria bacterium]
MIIQQITVLGATGSIGVSTLDVVARHPERYSVFALTGNTKVSVLAEQCRKYQPKYVVVMDVETAEQLRSLLADFENSAEVLVGADALCAVSSDSQVDIVMAAIVGAAGLMPTLAAVNANKKVLLANKESLVMAGHLFMEALKASSSVLLPIDSEHNAIFQCLPQNKHDLSAVGVSKLLLSASGGPFRGWTADQMRDVTPQQACAHPNWSMGSKISVDSATLMNKGLELIEACWLFDMHADQIEIVVHPQSIIHSLVQYIDGSVIAQLGNPDMRTPIAHALAWPERIDSGVKNLDLFDVSRLEFERPNVVDFPCLELACEAARIGLDAPTILNASNEIAVQAFLDERIAFTQIADVVKESMSNAIFSEPRSLLAVQESDTKARSLAAAYVSRIES